jgi:hypothetical protein
LPAEIHPEKYQGWKKGGQKREDRGRGENMMKGIEEFSVFEPHRLLE